MRHGISVPNERLAHPFFALVPGVQVDTAVESVLGSVETHHGLLAWVGA
jgi:hypothetical protein